MCKEEIIKSISEIDEQLEKNRKVIDYYSDVKINKIPNFKDVFNLCQVTRELVRIRAEYNDILARQYGIYVM